MDLRGAPVPKRKRHIKAFWVLVCPVFPAVVCMLFESRLNINNLVVLSPNLERSLEMAAEIARRVHRIVCKVLLIQLALQSLASPYTW